MREHPVLYDVIRDRVKPGRDANKRTAYREYWWRFGEPRVTLREAVEGLPRYIATPYVSKHRFFVFLDAEIAPDEKVVCIAAGDPLLLGVLSSTVHVTRALAAGARLEDRPTYNNSFCFDSFPFPAADPTVRDAVADLMTRLHAHRAEALARDESITMTGMYNVVEKLETGNVLSDAERRIQEIVACGVLRDLHNELDGVVAAAYGWPWPLEEGEILDRLVTLHDERLEEERSGTVRWLRPEYQVPRFARGEHVEQTEALEDDAEAQLVAAPATEPWHSSAVDQLACVKGSVAKAPGTAEDVTHRFQGAKVSLVERHLETLRLLAEVHLGGEGRYHAR